MKLIDADALIAKINILKERFVALHTKDGINWPLDNYGKMRAYNEFLSIINSMQEVHRGSVWHDSNIEQPKKGTTVVAWNGECGEILTNVVTVNPNWKWAYVDEI